MYRTIQTVYFSRIPEGSASGILYFPIVHSLGIIEDMSKNHSDNQDPHLFQKIALSVLIFIGLVIALGFLWSSSTAGVGLVLFILLVALTSVIIAMVLYFKKQKQIHEDEENQKEQYTTSMREITRKIIAQGNLDVLQNMEQRTLNHYLAFVMSQWGYRADVPDQRRGHSIDIWLYQGAQQFATWITKSTDPIVAKQMQEFSETYITQPHIFGVYITLGVFSDGARAWVARHNQKIWLVDAYELLSIIKRTDVQSVPWDAGIMAPLPPHPVQW